MMMSVFWYYRPEQTEVGRIPDFHGEVRDLGFVNLDTVELYFLLNFFLEFCL